MNEKEHTAHQLLTRLRYLLERLEGEFFHLQPDLEKNGSATSLALSSILNEAVNLQEMVFANEMAPNNASFWSSIKSWSSHQDWAWEDVEVRFTWWPICTTLKPFSYSDNQLRVAGRDANNSVKHHGELATLQDTITACGATWFLVLEKAREAEVFVYEREVLTLYDCYHLIEIRAHLYGHVIARPSNRLTYLGIRGKSEIPLAKAALERQSRLREQMRTAKTSSKK